MPLTLMYITNNVDVALIAQRAGVDRIWIDLEYIDKEKRQGGLDTVKSHHTVDDIKRLRPHIKESELLVRINPIHDATDAYCSTEEEIEETIAAGADVIMLPMFKTASDVKRFIRCVEGRTKTILLFETAESVENIDEILSIDGVDEVHIGLNDLHLAYKKDFMFELLCDGTVNKICDKFRKKGLKYGFGGIARVGYGMLPAEYIIAEHYNQGSTSAILSRGFCDANRVKDAKEIEDIFIEGVRNIRFKELEVAEYSIEQREKNLESIREKVSEIVLQKKKLQHAAVKKICIATTVAVTLKSFVVEMAKYLYQMCGYDITLICNNDEEFAQKLPQYIHYIPVKMSRGVDVFALSAIKEFKKIFKKEKFDMVQYATPNASFYASIAAKLAKVPIRLYCQWGIRYVGFSGFFRFFFKIMEKIICKNSTHIRAVSNANKQFAVEERLYDPEKALVVGNGGTIGVDMEKYDISQKSVWRKEIREKYGIEEGIFVFGFVGRVSREKGCAELFSAFSEIHKTNRNVKLFIVGPFENNCGVEEVFLNEAIKRGGVVVTGLIENQEMCKYYAAMDILVHPTYREGFGMVIQEAGALAVPVITTKIRGASEVMVDGESCLLVEPRSSEKLGDAMRMILTDNNMVKSLGKAAFDRTEKLYARPIMLENQRQAYMELLK